MKESLKSKKCMQLKLPCLGLRGYLVGCLLALSSNAPYVFQNERMKFSLVLLQRFFIKSSKVRVRETY
jgi:hypothetical protein